jgi:murein DD-endopeptidase MepM/ murein hydrolase activator NlpD
MIPLGLVWLEIFWVASLMGPQAGVASLRNASLRSPLPGGILSGYRGDTGLDIAAQFRPVYAVGSGTLDYSELGHTQWLSGKDTPYSIRIELDFPLVWRGRRVTHVYYTHLSMLARVQPERKQPRAHVEAGQWLGISGIGNGVPHLHIGFLLDGHVEQDAWDTLLVESEIRELLGGYRNGQRLP